MGNENECIPWLNGLEWTKDQKVNHQDNESYKLYLHDQRPMPKWKHESVTDDVHDTIWMEAMTMNQNLENTP